MNDSKVFLLTYAMLLLSWAQAFAFNGNGPALLAEHSAQANSAGIADDLKVFFRSGKVSMGRRIKHVSPLQMRRHILQTIQKRQPS